MLTVDYQRLGVRPGDLVLDLGCGAGRHAFEAFRRGARVVAYDLDDTQIKDTAAFLEALADQEPAHGTDGGRRLAAAINGDALHLPFPDGAFDRVIAAEVLEHVPTDRAAIAEMARVVRPGGSLAITVPRFGPELVCWALADEYHETPGGHVRIYRRGVLAARLEHAGLQVTDRHHAHALHSPYWWLRCAVGLSREKHPLVRAYHRILVWDIEGRRVVSPITRWLERALNPVLGKSLVLYARPATPPAVAR